MVRSRRVDAIFPKQRCRTKDTRTGAECPNSLQIPTPSIIRTFVSHALPHPGLRTLDDRLTEERTHLLDSDTQKTTAENTSSTSQNSLFGVAVPRLAYNNTCKVPHI